MIEQNWHPITMLPTFSLLIDGELSEDINQYNLLLQARPKPYVLNDAIVERTIQLYTEKTESIKLYSNQLTKWELELQLTDEQKGEIIRLHSQIKKINETAADILSLAEELSKGTIEKVMAKSDLELVTDFFKKGGKL